MPGCRAITSRASRRQRLLGAPAAVGRHRGRRRPGACAVWCAGRLVADHDRIWAKHQTISDPAHLAAAKAMRRNRFDVVTLPTQVEVQQRPLTDYDALIDIDGPVA